MIKKVAVITGTRAEYGLFYWTLKEIASRRGLELQLIVTGTHLSQKYGYTAEQIKRDGFEIKAEIPIVADDTPLGIAKTAGEATIKTAEVLDTLKPDLLLILGDRYEMLSAATAALLLNIPIAHIHGGEETEGAVDNQIRHAITKMASLHFPAMERYAQRIIKMGEDPGRVHIVGAPGIEYIKRAEIITRSDFFASVGLNEDRPYFLITFHPVTLDYLKNEQYIRNLLSAVDCFDRQMIFTYPNSDTNGDIIIKKIKEFVSARKYARAFKSMGQTRYVSAMKYAECMIGNSSSGIIEAPYFILPVVNIGDRQKGREKAKNIIDTGYEIEEIKEGISRCISDEGYKKSLNNIGNPYGEGNTSQKIVDVIESMEFDKKLLNKRTTY